MKNVLNWSKTSWYYLYPAACLSIPYETMRGICLKSGGLWYYEARLVELVVLQTP
uniref:Uncharacterized protein n=1 Tax=Yersinia enterocolitica TaxID=630 RepID=B0RKU5_YEREN|nr:hypothetical protein [Yersinia enterocolitica]